MKKVRLFTTIVLAALFIGGSAFSQTIGVLNYKTVLTNYNYAKDTIRMLDSKDTEMQQYMLDKEKQFKNISSPVERKNFEERIQREYKAKVDSLTKLKMQKEEEIYNNVLNVTKRIATQKKIDIVVDSSVIITGGIDITNDVISGLNSK